MPADKFGRALVVPQHRPLPSGPFDLILADPPWHFATYSDKGQGRSASRHYPTMDLDWICRLTDLFKERAVAAFLWEISQPSENETMTEEEQTMLSVNYMSPEERRNLIALATKTVTGIINRGEVPAIVVSVTPAGPKVYCARTEDVALRILKVIVDRTDWDSLPDPPATFNRAIRPDRPSYSMPLSRAIHAPISRLVRGSVSVIHAVSLSRCSAVSRQALPS